MPRMRQRDFRKWQTDVPHRIRVCTAQEVLPQTICTACTAPCVPQVYHHLKSIIKKKYGVDAVNVGDEGGFAPCIQVCWLPGCLAAWLGVARRWQASTWLSNGFRPLASKQQ